MKPTNNSTNSIAFFRRL